MNLSHLFFIESSVGNMIEHLYSVSIGSYTASFSNPYFQLTCLSVCLCVGNFDA